MTDLRQSSSAALRNRQPIGDVLERVLPPGGTVLEIAAGTGEHAVYLASRFPHHPWLPTDCNPLALESIKAWREAEPSPNLLAPIFLDVETNPWPVESTPPPEPIGAVLAINLIHISPWSATEALVTGAGRILPPVGLLYLYGPYRRRNQALEPSNEAFDLSLRQRNPLWGLRELETVTALAQTHGLNLLETVPMPAQNLSLIFRRAAVPETC
ncbi:MAG: DUF938 domain-containing protein [Cyanobacteria bacterium RI_101]|nr:DUF938 domain-containing protein [Cyanobacteria bacterium RI_101]